LLIVNSENYADISFVPFIFLILSLIVYYSDTTYWVNYFLGDQQSSEITYEQIKKDSKEVIFWILFFRTMIYLTQQRHIWQETS